MSCACSSRARKVGGARRETGNGKCGNGNVEMEMRKRGNA